MDIYKTIRLYAKLRGNGTPGLDYESLKKVYNESTPQQKIQYEREMNQYIKFIKSKKVKKGQSILHSVYEGNTNTDS